MWKGEKDEKDPPPIKPCKLHLSWLLVLVLVLVCGWLPEWVC